MALYILRDLRDNSLLSHLLGQILRAALCLPHPRRGVRRRVSAAPLCRHGGLLPAHEEEHRERSLRDRDRAPPLPSHCASSLPYLCQRALLRFAHQAEPPLRSAPTSSPQGLGIGIGQGVASYYGTRGDWRTPFLFVSVPTFFFTACIALFVTEPRRGAQARALAVFPVRRREKLHSFPIVWRARG